MGLVGSAVAGVQEDEVPDVGGDQRSSLGCRVSENLIVWKPCQGCIGDSGDDVVAAGAKVPGDLVREHLVQQLRLGHGLPGQQTALTQPGSLGGFLRGLGGGNLCVDLVWVGSPVADRCGHQA
jgi:hypothetical protein